SGGVFVSHTGGLSWAQVSSGLDGRDVFSLGQGPDGTILAGTEHGMFRLNGALWQRVGDDAAVAAADKAALALGVKGTPTAADKTKLSKATSKPVASRVAVAHTVVAAPAGKSFDASVYGFAV